MRMPANYPPSGTATRELSGMGTPDLVGTYGTFSFYTSDVLTANRQISSADIQYVEPTDGVVRSGDPRAGQSVPRGAGEGQHRVHGLRRHGTQSANWWPVTRSACCRSASGPTGSPSTSSCSPCRACAGWCASTCGRSSRAFSSTSRRLNLDPLEPALPISTPASFAAELAEATGRFYTQGMPEDTRSLQEGIFTREEFLEQARLAGDDVRRQYRLVLDQFDSGLLFYYFGNLDQTSHMMFRHDRSRASGLRRRRGRAVS